MLRRLTIASPAPCISSRSSCRSHAGAPLPRALYDRVRGELAGRFGGLTAFTRAPAEGHWRTEGETKRDDIVVFEVMTESLDEAFWRAHRRELEQSFRQ